MEKYLKIRRLILNSNLFPKESCKELSKKICILLNNDMNRNDSNKNEINSNKNGLDSYKNGINSYKKNKNIGNDTNIIREGNSSSNN